jgi:hypothetical protein
MKINFDNGTAKNCGKRKFSELAKGLNYNIEKERTFKMMENIYFNSSNYRFISGISENSAVSTFYLYLLFDISNKKNININNFAPELLKDAYNFISLNIAHEDLLMEGGFLKFFYILPNCFFSKNTQVEIIKELFQTLLENNPLFLFKIIKRKECAKKLQNCI